MVYNRKHCEVWVKWIAGNPIAHLYLDSVSSTRVLLLMARPMILPSTNYLLLDVNWFLTPLSMLEFKKQLQLCIFKLLLIFFSNVALFSWCPFPVQAGEFYSNALGLYTLLLLAYTLDLEPRMCNCRSEENCMTGRHIRRSLFAEQTKRCSVLQEQWVLLWKP